MLAGSVLKVMYAMDTPVDPRNLCRAPRGKFHRDIAGTAKQVEYFYAFKIYLVQQDIKQGFFGHVGSGAYR